MKIVSLVNTLPNQSMTFTEDSDFYEVTVRSVQNFTTIDISRNGTVIAQGLRCVPSSLLLAQYKEGGRGNFAFWNDKEQYPVYTDFGVTTFLAYYSPTDLAGARA